MCQKMALSIIIYGSQLYCNYFVKCYYAHSRISQNLESWTGTVSIRKWLETQIFGPLFCCALSSSEKARPTNVKIVHGVVIAAEVEAVKVWKIESGFLPRNSFGQNDLHLSFHMLILAAYSIFCETRRAPEWGNPFPPNFHHIRHQ